jgi:hypothetical protein
MNWEKIHESAIQIIFKIVRLHCIIKYYRWGRDFGGVKSRRTIRSLRLVNDSGEYKIIDEIKSRAIYVIWPEKFSKSITIESNLDGYWPVDVLKSRGGAESYHLYWLYPFGYNLHVWRLNANGERVGFYDANDFYKYQFFFNRLRWSSSFRVRLYMLCVARGDEKTCAALRADLLADAKGGFSEAIFCVLSAPKLFSEEEVRSCMAQAASNINDISKSRVPLHERELQMVTLEKLSEALEGCGRNLESISSAYIQHKIDYCAAFGDIRYAELQSEVDRAAIIVHENVLADNYMGLNFNEQSIAIVGRPEDSTLDFHVLNSSGGARKRIMDCIGYANYLIAVCGQEKIPDCRASIVKHKWIVDFETGDLPSRNQCISFVRGLGSAEIGLIPDIYFYLSWGFRRGWIDGAVPPWASKTTMFTWRGITTGGHNHTVESIATLPRFRMCAIGSELGPLADMGISQIVQAQSKEDAGDVEAHIKSMGLFKDHIPQHVMGSSKFLLDIDGNSNSWGFFAKLLMGCCVLKVDSPYEQWFYQDIKPWVHYIPIARDLSDLLETMEWCLLNEPACRDIASTGMAFAQARTFDREMTAAAATLASAARPLG